jgi:hypothetical protein
MAAQPGNVRDLQAAHHVRVILRHDEQVSRVGIDVGERLFVGVIHDGRVSCLTQHVVGEERDDRGKVGTYGFSEDHTATLATPSIDKVAASS